MSAAALVLLAVAVLVLVGSAGAAPQALVAGASSVVTTSTSSAVDTPGAVDAADAVDAGAWGDQDGDDRPDALTDGPQPAWSASHGPGPAHGRALRSAQSAPPVVAPD